MSRAIKGLHVLNAIMEPYPRPIRTQDWPPCKPGPNWWGIEGDHDYAMMLPSPAGGKPFARCLKCGHKK